jgi:glutathione S-transferase
MPEYLEVEQAKTADGLRLVLTAGVPGPWGEAAKSLFDVKKIPYLAIKQQGGAVNQQLLDWTGFDNAPQAIYRDERPRIGWSEIVLLAERLEPSPPLVPDEPGERARMFGLLHEIAGEMGFAWCRRLQLFQPILSQPAEALPAHVREPLERMGAKYGYSDSQAKVAGERVSQILELLSQTLRGQRERGLDYMIGARLSAADIYWATFAAMLQPLPEEQCPMGDFMRAQYTMTDSALLADADPILLQHRDRIYRDHLKLPLDF